MSWLVASKGMHSGLPKTKIHPKKPLSVFSRYISASQMNPGFFRRTKKKSLKQFLIYSGITGKPGQQLRGWSRLLQLLSSLGDFFRSLFIQGLFKGQSGVNWAAQHSPSGACGRMLPHKIAAMWALLGSLTERDHPKIPTWAASHLLLYIYQCFLSSVFSVQIY